LINKDILFTMLSKIVSRMFSTTPNVWVNKHTKVICQGITGNQVSTFVSLGNFPNSAGLGLWNTNGWWSQP
jgi:hypothetical protein